MSRAPRWLLVAAFAALLAPAPAYAVESLPTSVDSLIRLGISLVGLLIAALLLLEARKLGKAAAGGAIAEKLRYVVLATLCLASSALAEWVLNFVPMVTMAQVQLASEVLVIVAMALLALYFASVRHGLTSFMKAMTGSQLLDREVTGTATEESPADSDGDVGRG
ncbi:MAG: hypothetical protein U1E26_08235 [Coriobacteriia bacterium]|nr:hypothetical protein [Coriobacteriia bacterium]